MDFFDISEGDDNSRNGDGARRGGSKEKVSIGSTHGSEGSSRDVGETGSISPQALKYFLGENSKKKKAKRAILKKKYKKWKGKHKKLEKDVKAKESQLFAYHKDINTTIDKWSKWKKKYHELENSTKTIGRSVPISPLFSGKGMTKKFLF